MSAPKILYNKEIPLRVCQLKNRNNKIIPLSNWHNRLIPMPVKFLHSFVVRKASADRLGRVIFNYYPVVREYSYLYQFIQDELLVYHYQTVEELSYFLQELDLYLYKTNELFEKLDEDDYIMLSYLRRRFECEVQEGRSPYNIKLIKSFFAR